MSAHPERKPQTAEEHLQLAEFFERKNMTAKALAHVIQSLARHMEREAR